MRTHSCVTWRTLLSVFMVMAVAVALTPTTQAQAPLALVDWNEATMRLEPAATGCRELGQVAFVPEATAERPIEAPVSLLWSRRTDEYGRFLRVSTRAGEAACVPVRWNDAGLYQ